METIDCTCPHCKEHIDDLAGYFGKIEIDKRTKIVCPNCGNKIDLDIQFVIVATKA